MTTRSIKHQENCHKDSTNIAKASYTSQVFVLLVQLKSIGIMQAED